jgi:hypothetical protein
VALTQLNGAAIHDWDSFHDQCAAAFGFPAFYGRNMDAWIDCLSSVRDGDGMSRFAIGPRETLVVEVLDTESFSRHSPEILKEFVECTGFVNRRYATAEEMPPLLVLFR